MNQFLVILSTLLVGTSVYTYVTNSSNFEYECSISDKPMDAIFADMHDGDKKRIKIAGKHMTILPYGNNETWVVNAVIDVVYCNATVDFNVTGKPNPPPVKLIITAWEMVHVLPQKYKVAFEFTDPSGTLGPSTTPLNIWIMIGSLAN